VSDFDGVTFHISTPESKTKILVSIQVKCFNELVKYGAQQVLEREYGPYVVSPENGYNFSVQVDLDSLPDDKGRLVLLCSGFHSSANVESAMKKHEMT
jgi:actin related protein 2/3 complex subunit 2